ncbi:PXA domain-containing protein [Sporobolomyces salmoneus]|uniref:PXA domain-containing protein n=1 Tax=Sporobolomyces salmoneus TaxID=183962 RepID=UPI00317DC1F3
MSRSPAVGLSSTSDPRRRSPLPTLATPKAFDSARPAPPLYQKILYPANGTPATPPRILHSSAHSTLDPLILDLIALSLRAFVTPWYNGGISRDPDKDFLQAVTAILIHVIQALEVRLATIDWTELLLRDLPALMEDHYRDWDLANEKAGGSSAHNLSTEEMFHHLEPHIAISLVGGAPRVDPVYMRTLVDHLLKLLLPPEDYRAETERAIVREVLVGVVFGSVFGKVAQPWFSHGVVAKLIEGREADKLARTKRTSLETGTTPSSPSILDQIVSIVARLPGIAISTLSSLSNFFISANATHPPSHDPYSPPLHSNVFSLILAILPRSTTLSQLVHFASLPLSLISRTLDAYFYRTVTTSLTTEQTLKTVLEGITRGMFPNDGWPAEKDPDPDAEGQQELKQRCEAAIARLLPNKASLFFFPPNEAPSETEKDPSLLLARRLIRPFSSHVANVHLFVLVLDLLIGKLFPELIVTPEE